MSSIVDIINHDGLIQRPRKCQHTASKSISTNLSTKSSQCSLRAVPAEIRQMIFGYTLATPESNSSLLNALRPDNMLHDEALATHYKHNPVIIIKENTKNLSHLSPQTWHLVQHIVIRYSTEYTVQHKWLDLYGRFTGQHRHVSHIASRGTFPNNLLLDPMRQATNLRTITFDFTSVGPVDFWKSEEAINWMYKQFKPSLEQIIMRCYATDGYAPLGRNLVEERTDFMNKVNKDMGVRAKLLSVSHAENIKGFPGPMTFEVFQVEDWFWSVKGDVDASWVAYLGSGKYKAGPRPKCHCGPRGRYCRNCEWSCPGSGSSFPNLQ